MKFLGHTCEFIVALSTLQDILGSPPNYIHGIQHAMDVHQTIKKYATTVIHPDASKHLKHTRFAPLMGPLLNREVVNYFITDIENLAYIPTLSQIHEHFKMRFTQ